MEIINPIQLPIKNVIRYSIEEINEIENKIDIILDNDIITKLLEIKKVVVGGGGVSGPVARGRAQEVAGM